MTTAKHILSRMGLLEPARRTRAALRHTAHLALHPVREALVRLPDPRFLASGGRRLPAPYDHHLAELQRYGITRLSGHIAAETLTTLQRDFQSNFIARLQAGSRSAAACQGDMTVTDEYVDREARLYASNEPFAISRALLEVCLKPELVALIDGYLGKRAYITQGIALRIDPHPQTGFGSFQWHHDAWGKRINMMIILTEVGTGDQYMTYAKGSHALRHSYDKYANSRYSAEEFAKHCSGMEVLDCVARPGDIYVFDSNGLHSGNRSMGRTRDTFIIHYTRMWQAVWAHRIPPEFLAGMREEELRPLAWMRAQDRTRRTLAPPSNSWVDGLMRLSQWSA
jgi:hypothetical protein